MKATVPLFRSGRGKVDGKFDGPVFKSEQSSKNVMINSRWQLWNVLC